MSKEIDKRNKLNDLSGKEWIVETKSFFFQKGLGANSKEAKYEKMHPAPFSYTDISRLIKFFTKKGNKVLDPFLGIGSTIKACIELEREGYGVEINSHWCDLTKERLLKECKFKINSNHLICDDSKQLLKHYEKNYFDFIVTSPPYWNILNKEKDYKAKERITNGYVTKYSEDNELDLGNIKNYDDFLDSVVDIFFQCYDVLKPEKYMCIIVSDFRHKSEFISYHSDLIQRMTKRKPKKFILNGIKILVQNAKKLYPYGYPYSYVENIHHQYVLIFKKPK